MRHFLKLTTAAAALAGAAAFGAPAGAADVGIGVGPVGFDIYSGGYCDRWGCPGDYWNYPIFYGPVYYGSAWYRGPVYYRTVDGERSYWIHGAWHRDQWRGARPGWAREVRYGRPLGLDYYRAHGFRVRDEDWRAWADRDYRTRTGYRDYDRGGTYGNEDRYRDEDRGYDRDRYQDRGTMDRDRMYDRDYDRDRGTYEQSGYDRDNDRDNDRHSSHMTYGRSDQGRTGPDDQTRDHGNSGQADQNRDRDRSGSENGYEHTNYDKPSSYGHAKAPPPVTSHSSSRSKPANNPDDENNGPSN